MVLFLFLFHASKAAVQSVFYLSPPCLEAQKHIAALRLVKARQILSEEKKAHPNNAAIGLLENYIDFYRIATSLDFSTFKTMEQKKSERFAVAKSIPETSPYHLYAQSEMHLQYAFAKAMNEEYVSAMLDFRSAYQLAVENQNKFPAFKQSLKTVGMFKALLGTTGKSYRWVLSIAGLKGNFEEGMKLLGDYFKADLSDEFLLDKQAATFYYVLLQLNYGDKQLAWNFCEEHTRDYSTSLMSNYLRGYTGMRTAQKEEAIGVLQNRPKSAEYEPFAALEYYYALCKLYRLDADADIYFKHFISVNKNKVLTKEAYKRLTWFYLVNHDEEKFLVYHGMIKRYGSSQNEDDKNLQREILAKTPHDVIVLKARLLADGGYYQKAEETIRQRNTTQFASEYQRLEYYFRYARILQEQNKLSKATEYYQLVIKNSPENTPWHFAPYANFYLGQIYMKLGFSQMARSYFVNVGKYKKAEYIETAEVRAAKELQLLK